MRITLTIDSDVLAVARALAERNGTSLGRALSELARRQPLNTGTTPLSATASEFLTVHVRIGFPRFEVPLGKRNVK